MEIMEMNERLDDAIDEGSVTEMAEINNEIMNTLQS